MATVVLIAATGGPVVVGLVLLAVLVVWLGVRRRCVFRIHVEEGEVRHVVGHAPEPFVHEVDRLCRFWRIHRGWIKGVRRGQQVALRIGGGMDRQHLQAFRNAWNYPIR